jgi:hypothetical protein
MTRKGPLPVTSLAHGNELPNGAWGRTRKDSSAASQPARSDAEYKVGPGRPPREYRFKLNRRRLRRISSWRSSVRSTRQ